MRWTIGTAELPLAILLALQIFAHHKVSAEGEGCNKAGFLNNAPGVCINIKSCNTYLDILRREGAAASTFLRQSVCYYNGNDPVVCCPTNGNSSPTIPTIPSYNSQTQNSSFGPLYAPDCGFSKFRPERVVGGSPAELGDFPWIAALGYRDAKQRNKPKWRCGGSLISKQHVLTAAHCVYNQNDLFLVRLGDHDLIDENEVGANPIDVRIQRAVYHPGYSPTNYVNDIAVLRLRYPVNFTPAIHPICLPVIPEIRDRNYVGNFPFVAGWGQVYFNGPTSNILQHVQLPVVSEEACAKAFAPFPKQVIDNRVLCAGYIQGGKDACKGDSGGPLMFPKRNNYYIIGVVSFGYRCAEAGFPGVYTRVTHFMDFIMENLK